MNDLRLYIAIGLPTIAVLASVTVSLFYTFSIRKGVRAIRDDLRAICAHLKPVEK